jgi:DNA (cytosine-5)-methyltransferase 1
VIALDLFAGTGWGVALQQLGIEELGVDNAPEVIATRKAAEMTTIYADVWDGLIGDDAPYLDYDMLIASPPCQTFSLAGKGSGRKSLSDVLSAIDQRLYRDPQKLHDLGEIMDPRTALVLAPLAQVYRDRPRLVIFEQVTQVRPVWEACAAVMRMGGYSVATGILNSEQYGVPQTRRRAILVARNDGIEAKMPTPTHSRYHAGNPSKLDPGVKKWVTMAEALGWGMTERPYLTVASGTEAGGGTDPAALGGSGARRTVLGEREAGRWMFAGAGATAQETSGQRPRELDEPAHTITTKQTAVFRPDRGLKTAEQQPEKWGDDLNKPMEGRSRPTVSGASEGGLEVWATRPATTIMAGSDVVAGPGWSDPVAGGVPRQKRPGSLRVSADEAAILQSFPHGFPFQGNKGRVFRQIGNAVPPLMAKAIIEELTR